MDQLLLSPRAARTRSALLAAGMDLLVKRPVDAIAIDEFVSAAGVAKGSFFNHFADKQQFAHAIARNIRVEVEGWVGRLNAGVPDPLERLAGGMVAAAAYALVHPQRTIVLARSLNGTSHDDHPLNAGLLQDLRDALATGSIDIPTEQIGVLYWLGACQAMMANIVERGADEAAASQVLIDMLKVALRGLAAPPSRIIGLVDRGVILGKFRLLYRPFAIVP